MNGDMVDDYQALRLPRPLLDHVKEFVDDNDEGFKSVPEVIKAAIRDFLAKRRRPPFDQ